MNGNIKNIHELKKTHNMPNIVKKIGLVISSDMFENKQDGNNINGPSLIKVPNFVNNPLGKYYLYFGHHNGKYIRMAYSDSICGPYILYEKGTLNINQIPGYGHLASPDVHVDTDNNRIIMYYHCPYNNGKTSQSTFYAYSYDGIHFETQNTNIEHPYFRYFVYKDNEYGLAMYNLECTVLMKKNNSSFSVIGKILPKSRHTSIIVINNNIYVYYSKVGDCPEHIYVAELVIDNNTIAIKNETSLIMPEQLYENNSVLPEKSKYGIATTPVCQLRDPYVYKENDIIYIFYTVAGEQGIAIAIIEE